MELKLINLKLKSSLNYQFQVVKRILEVFQDSQDTIEGLQNISLNQHPHSSNYSPKIVNSIWNLDFQLAYKTLKAKISEAPFLRGPNWKLTFHISIDASDIALGVVLGQNDLIPYAIYYTRKNLTPTELNYTVTENEFLVVVHAVNKFRHYITGYETFVHTNHFAVRY